jgi:hypothetical protein
VLCFFFVLKSSRLWDNVKKYCRPGQATDDYGACALHAVYLRLQKHTFGICNTYCFSIATVVARTRLNGALYIHCLSCHYFYSPPWRSWWGCGLRTEFSRYDSRQVQDMSSWSRPDRLLSRAIHLCIAHRWLFPPRCSGQGVKLTIHPFLFCRG